MDRRETLKVLIGTSLMAFVPASFALKNMKKDKSKKHLVMVIDLSRCNGCKACTVSCGVENGNKVNEHRCEVEQSSIKIGDKNFVMNLPLLCNNCEEPSCVDVCPTEATYKRDEDGIVVIDSSTCIGCNYCIKACPYTGTRFENTETSTVDKCTFCVHRTSQGLLPACVETCIGEAREFGDLNDPNSKVTKIINENNAMVLEATKGTKPNVFYIGLNQYQSNKKHSLHNNLTWQR